MKTFETFYEGVVLLTWLILLLSYGLSSLIYGKDYSPSNNLIITFIILTFLQTQFMIKWEIQKLKEKQ
jgi:hypothetical protein